MSRTADTTTVSQADLETMPGYGTGRRNRERGGENVLFGARHRSKLARAGGDVDASLDPETVARLHVSGSLAEIAIGGELVPDDDRELRDTVTNPDFVTLDASRDRLEMASRANILESALDAADSIDASNSLEKMLAHQMALLHKYAMKMGVQMEDLQHTARPFGGMEIRERNVEICRLTNTMAKLTSTYAQAFITLQRVRSKGRQTVIVKHTVQHVHVNQGGQAVVAGKMSKGGGGGKLAKSRRGSTGK